MERSSSERERSWGGRSEDGGAKTGLDRFWLDLGRFWLDLGRFRLDEGGICLDILVLSSEVQVPAASGQMKPCVWSAWGFDLNRSVLNVVCPLSNTPFRAQRQPAQAPHGWNLPSPYTLSCATCADILESWSLPFPTSKLCAEERISMTDKCSGRRRGERGPSSASRLCNIAC